jgi:hypothetical protein
VTPSASDAERPVAERRSHFATLRVAARSGRARPGPHYSPHRRLRPSHRGHLVTYGRFSLVAYVQYAPRCASGRAPRSASRCSVSLDVGVNNAGLRSRGAQRAVALAATARDLVALVGQAVGRVEHAARRRRARGAPREARALARPRALLVRPRSRIVHATVLRRARGAEVKARAGAAREAREVGPGPRMKRTRRGRAAHRRQHDRRARARRFAGRHRRRRRDRPSRLCRRRCRALGVGGWTTCREQRSNNHDHMAHRAVIARAFRKRSFVEPSHMGLRARDAGCPSTRARPRISPPSSEAASLDASARRLCADRARGVQQRHQPADRAAVQSARHRPLHGAVAELDVRGRRSIDRDRPAPTARHPPPDQGILRDRAHRQRVRRRVPVRDRRLH